MIATGVGCLGREAENAPWGMSSGLALEETPLLWVRAHGHRAIKGDFGIICGQTADIHLQGCLLQCISQ